jgi:hypothetical protein
MTFFFFFTKAENRRAEQEMRWGNGGGGLLCKSCAHVYVNGKMGPAKTVPGMGGRNKGE